MRTREALEVKKENGVMSADQDRRQTTWWLGLCGSARTARRCTPLPAT
jgi:hypothetical protein